MNTTTTAPAKIILLGEHAVVYGQPALAVPFNALRAFAEIQTAPIGSGIQIVSNDITGSNLVVNAAQDDLTHPFAIASKLLLIHFSAPVPDVKIVLRSDIPIASGLGSGAAITTALLRAIAIVLNKTLSVDDLNSIVYETEKLFHGTPSGIDNTVVVYERPVYFVRSQPIERLKIGKSFTLLVADTGVSASTKVAVSDVRTLFDSDNIRYSAIFKAIGNLVIAGREAVEMGDHLSLGTIMNENHSLLQELTVSSMELDNLILAARNAGALGAKLSGGGRGGNMIALVDQNVMASVKSHLLEMGAVRVYQTVVGEV